jgi:hypothetical protein
MAKKKDLEARIEALEAEVKILKAKSHPTYPGIGLPGIQPLLPSPGHPYTTWNSDRTSFISDPVTPDSTVA